MKNLVIFDLDDTLYPEIEFVRSGFEAVAREFAPEFSRAESELYDLMLHFSAARRDKVFDRLLEHLYLSSDQYLHKMVSLYRRHLPNIALYQDVQKTIKDLKKNGVKVGIITDGYLETQGNKIKALKLDAVMDKIIFTDQWGKAYWKPHPRAFREMLKYFNLEAGQSLYVGDNPVKDFLAPNKLGMQSVMILRDEVLYRDKEAPAGGEPSCRIKCLTELLGII